MFQRLKAKAKAYFAVACFMAGFGVTMYWFWYEVTIFSLVFVAGCMVAAAIQGYRSVN